MGGDVMNETDDQKLKRLMAEYFTPAVEGLYDRVMAGEPLTALEIRLWNIAAGSELQIGPARIAPVTKSRRPS